MSLIYTNKLLDELSSQQLKYRTKRRSSERKEHHTEKKTTDVRRGKPDTLFFSFPQISRGNLHFLVGSKLGPLDLLSPFTKFYFKALL